jgi:hypothetical protein
VFYRARFIAVMVCLLASVFAPRSVLAQTPRTLEVVDLGTDASPDTVAKARAGFKTGTTILRVMGGKQADVERLIGIPLMSATVKSATGLISRAELLSRPSSQLRGAAAYKDARGMVRSVLAFASDSSWNEGTERWRNSLDTWIEHEQSRALTAAADSSDPEPPPEAWTAIFRTTLITEASSNQAELTIGVFRLNSISLGKDYYMVATVPQTTPAFDGTCNGFYYGWHTLGRSIYTVSRRHNANGGRHVDRPRPDNNHQ